MSPSLSICLINARSLANKIDQLQILLNSKKFQILCFTETWLSSKINDPLLCPTNDYNIFRSDRTTHGGGSAIFVSSALSVTRVTVPRSSFFEIVCIDIYDLTMTQNFRFINCYIPPKSIKTGVIEEFCSALAILMTVKHKKIILGDFNMPNIPWNNFSDNNPLLPEKIFFDFMKTNKFFQLVKKPTRENNILDLILTDDMSLISCLDIVPSNLTSDHNQINFKFFPMCQTEEIRDFLHFNYKKCDFETLNHSLANFDWLKLFSSLENYNVDTIYESFIYVLQNFIHDFVPLEKGNSLGVPNHIQKIYLYRSKLWNHIQFPDVRKKFKRTDDILKRETEKFFRNREKRLLLDKTTKRLNSYVSSQLKNKNISIPALTGENGRLYVNAKDKANILASHFSSVFVKNRFQKNDAINENEIRDIKIDTIIFDSLDVYKILLNLDSKTNTSPDKISNIFLKNCAISLTFPINYIFNYSIMTGTVPNIWKKSIVTPLHKKDSRSNASNYRPISLTCSLSKVMETLVHSQLSHFFEANNIIPDCQHGFSKGKSTTTQLLECFDDWTNALDKGFNVDIVYFDISKAFDSVDHNKLLLKLFKVGVGGNLLKWIENWLKNRDFVVKVDESISDNFEVLSGVPQGSLLGPLLFNLFISDLVEFCKTENVSVKMYADDLKAYIIYSNQYDTLKLQLFINKLSEWCNTNYLKIASDKCRVLFLGTKNAKTPYFVNTLEIAKVTDSITDLGVDITPDLKWSSHIKKRCDKAYGLLFSLFKAVRSKNSLLLKNLYISYVRPILEYASSVANPYLKKDIEKLESVQKMATKLIHFRCFKNDTHHFSYVETLQRLRLKTLQERRLINDLVLYHKIFYKRVRIKLNSFKCCHMRNTRYSKFRLNIDSNKSDPRHNFFLVKCSKIFPEIYSKLPFNTDFVPSSHCLKLQLEKFDLSPYLK